jgi:TatD DNase family protein
MLTDTHCHIHETVAPVHHDEDSHNGGPSMYERWKKAGKTAEGVIADAAEAGVTRMICVGCTTADSGLAVDFVQGRENLWASIGIHPHEAQYHANKSDLLKKFADLATQPKVVAVGECGLDYYYNHSPKEDQEKMLRFQIELALQHDLPMIFHVREAFDDFWKIFDSYKNIRGVIHSFTATEKELGQIIERGLYIGLNGIMTFTKNDAQLAAAKAVPLNRLLLETDAPFLTPAPKRNEICEPKHVRVTAEFLANLRGESLGGLATATNKNAAELFNFKQ